MQAAAVRDADIVETPVGKDGDSVRQFEPRWRMRCDTMRNDGDEDAEAIRRDRSSRG